MLCLRKVTCSDCEEHRVSILACMRAPTHSVSGSILGLSAIIPVTNVSLGVPASQKLSTGSVPLSRSQTWSDQYR
jgi:hypothetical protein